MKNQFKSILILFVSFAITSCGVLRAPNINKLVIGMDKQTAITAVGKQPDLVVGAKKYQSGNVEVLSYMTSLSNKGQPEYYWLFFYNNNLSQFGPAEGNWQRAADDIAYAEEHKLE